MDGWLKALVAAACVVVIAGGGYFAWNQWTAAESAAADQEAANVRSRCLAGLREVPINQPLIAGCLLNGGLTKSEVDAEIRRLNSGG